MQNVKMFSVRQVAFFSRYWQMPLFQNLSWNISYLKNSICLVINLDYLIAKNRLAFIDYFE